MTLFPETRRAWKRTKLLWAELLVSGFAKGDHSYAYLDRVNDACDAIATFREIHYPELPSQDVGGGK